LAERCKHDHSEGLLARGGVHPRDRRSPWANLERVAQALGRSTAVHEYADPRRVAQELAEGVRRAYEEVDLSETLIRHLQEPIGSAY
jgi:hypothetical protein